MDLRKHRTVNTKPPDVPAVPGLSEQNKKKTQKMAAAERQRAYRQRVKENPEKYKQQKEGDRLRCKLWRMNRSEEQEQRDRDLCKQRSVVFRARQKASGTKPASKRTRKQTLAQAEKWREYKRKERAAMPAQKRRRVNERRRALYAQKKEAEKKADEVKASRNLEKTPSLFTSENARWKAISRSLHILPRSPDKFALVLSSVVGKSTPRRKSALKKKCILSPGSKKKLAFNCKHSVKNYTLDSRKQR